MHAVAGSVRRVPPFEARLWSCFDDPPREFDGLLRLEPLEAVSSLGYSSRLVHGLDPEFVVG